MTVRVLTPPEVEPITLLQAKMQLRMDADDEDDLIEALIVAARDYAERYTGRAFVTQTLELTLPCFSHCIVIPRPPLVSIDYVNYIDVNGETQAVDADLYQVDTYREPGLLAPAYQEVWPDTRYGDFNAVQIGYKAGYGDEDAVPEMIKHWMKIRVAQLFEHREAIVTGTIVANIPRDFVDGLLDPFKVNIPS